MLTQCRTAKIALLHSLTAAQVQSIGFTLADKQAGPFRLEVAWIRAEKVDDASPAPTTQPAE